jgi:hypothetical protein
LVLKARLLYYLHHIDFRSSTRNIPQIRIYHNHAGFGYPPYLPQSQLLLVWKLVHLPSVRPLVRSVSLASTAASVLLSSASQRYSQVTDCGLICVDKGNGVAFCVCFPFLCLLVFTGYVLSRLMQGIKSPLTLQNESSTESTWNVPREGLVCSVIL